LKARCFTGLNKSKEVDTGLSPWPEAGDLNHGQGDHYLNELIEEFWEEALQWFRRIHSFSARNYPPSHLPLQPEARKVSV